jgi:tetratricopeptide (TPR) repeat protein
MTDASDDKRHFFISFTGADRPWARWLARTLAEAGYTYWFQDQDFAGSIPRSIAEAHERSERTILLLSDAYASSGFCRSEWEARYMEDPGSAKDLLIPFRAGPCVVTDPLLARLAFQDLFNKDQPAARELVRHRLRQAVERGYRVPLGGALFPGAHPDAPFPVPIHNLPSPNPDFVGRKDGLTAIHEALSAAGSATRAYAITGLGGVGKTQTALAYCYRHLADYRLIWWFRGAEPATLAANYITLAEPLELPEERDQAKTVQAVKAKLQVTHGWLLVLDNAEDPTVVRPYLPGTGGRVLLTSRRTDWEGTAAERVLKEMTEDEALQLLLPGRPDPAALPGTELAEAKALARNLGHLPLALAQARAYMQETGKNLAGYRRLFQASRPRVLDRGQASPDYPASVAKTWQVSIDAAAGACPAAHSLLELLAFFAPDALPMAVLGSAPEVLPEGLHDEIERDDAIAALTRFSLIGAEAGIIAVHRLVQAVTRDGLDEATAKARAEAAIRLVQAALPDQPQEHINWPIMGMLLPHALAAAEAAKRLGAGLKTAATVLNQTALYHYARAAWAEAEPLYERAIAIGEKTLGPEHPDLATHLSNLARLYRATGRYAEAEPLYERAIAIDEKALGPEHPGLATDFNNLAGLYRDTGRYAEAEPL